MDWEQEALNLIQKLASHYVEQRDMNAVNTYLEGRTSWIGTGRNEVSRNREEARQALTRETEEYSGAFRITQLQCETAALNGSGCICIFPIRIVFRSRGATMCHTRRQRITRPCGRRWRCMPSSLKT